MRRHEKMVGIAVIKICHVIYIQVGSPSSASSKLKVLGELIGLLLSIIVVVFLINLLKIRDFTS